jgi:HSP20 family protein
MSRFIDFFSPLARLRDDLDEFMERPLEDLSELEPPVASYPAINAWQEGDDVVIESELPGLSIEDVNVLVSGSDVTIGGRYKRDESASDTCLRRECARSAFTRTINLPWEVNAEQTSARLVDGVLTVRLPKAQQTEARRIAVATA